MKSDHAGPIRRGILGRALAEINPPHNNGQAFRCDCPGVVYNLYYGDTWINDTSFAMWKTTVPDKADKLYDLDEPNCGPKIDAAMDSLEINFNARQFVTWDDVECSYKNGDDAKWHFQVRWKNTESPKFVSASVSTGNLDLKKYVTPEYERPVP